MHDGALLHENVWGDGALALKEQIGPGQDLVHDPASLGYKVNQERISTVPFVHHHIHPIDFNVLRILQ